MARMTDHRQWWRGARHTAVATALLLLAAATACDGTATGVVPYTGIIGPTGTGGSGGSGASLIGTFVLLTAGGDTLPGDTLISDSLTNVDSTYVFRATLDSSFIILESDTTAVEYNYTTVEEKIFGPSIGTVIFTTAPIVVGDTLVGTYSYTPATAQVALTLNDTVTADSGGVEPSGTFVFGYTSDTLSGNVTYSLLDLLGTLVETNTSAFVYVNNGTGPSLDRVPSAVIRSAATSRTALRQRMALSPADRARLISRVRTLRMLRTAPLWHVRVPLR
jgi:hypothetical protein